MNLNIYKQISDMDKLTLQIDKEIVVSHACNIGQKMNYCKFQPQYDNQKSCNFSYTNVK